MAARNISDKFQGLKISESKDINILLLGETGVGKSTFINSIANYIHFKSFKKALKADEPLVLIPAVITVTNEHFEQISINVGSDSNEFQEIGAAGTQDVKTYVFPIGEGKTRLRLIDSPGVGDPRGIEQDDINCENILAYLSQLEELHAICFLMRPTNTRKTILFEYCVNQILSRLEKSASKNIVFIFTNTRGTNYTPGDTLPCLKTIIDEIKSKPPHVEIPLRGNIFSFDNESFRFLVAMKKNIKFSEEVQQRCIESWNTSSAECWRLVSYIVGDASHDPLKPHQLWNTISINEARRLIICLSKPLADISQLIHDNLRILEKHQRHLAMDNQSLDELKKKLYIPIINLEITMLTQPVTVCTSSKCADVVQVGDLKKWHYRQRCHDPCYLTNVTKEVVGDLNLMHCAAMNATRTCQKCTCDFSVHMHVYYLTNTVSDKVVDNNVQDNIRLKEHALAESRRLMSEIDRRKVELEQERELIITSTARFAHFLQHNAISPFNDSYQAYIEYLITREKSLGRNGDPEVIYHLEQLLHRYKEIKATFDNSLQVNQKYGLDTVVTSTVTAQSVLKTIQQLYQLKHNGKKIHELVEKQKLSRKSEYDKSCEYVHPKSSDLGHSESEKKKSKKEKKGDKKSDDEGRKNKNKDGKNSDVEKQKKKLDDGGKKSKIDGKNFDAEGQNKKVYYNRNFSSRSTSSSHEQHVSQPLPNTTFGREPPPPYPGVRSDNNSRTYQFHQQHTSRDDKQDSNLVLKLELKQLQKDRPVPYGHRDNPYRHQDSHLGPNYNYQGPNYGPGYSPTQPFSQGPPFHPPYGQRPGSYYNGPHGPYRPDQRQGQSGPSYEYHGPSGSYYGAPPPQNFGAGSDQRYGFRPPVEHYTGNSLYTSSQEAPSGPHRNPQQYKKFFTPGAHHGHRGRNRGFYHNRKSGGRGRSKTRYSDKKSGNEKNSNSPSSSESSSE